MDNDDLLKAVNDVRKATDGLKKAAEGLREERYELLRDMWQKTYEGVSRIPYLMLPMAVMVHKNMASLKEVPIDIIQLKDRTCLKGAQECFGDYELELEKKQYYNALEDLLYAEKYAALGGKTLPLAEVKQKLAPRAIDQELSKAHNALEQNTEESFPLWEKHFMQALSCAKFAHLETIVHDSLAKDFPLVCDNAIAFAEYAKEQMPVKHVLDRLAVYATKIGIPLPEKFTAYRASLSSGGYESPPEFRIN